VGRTLRLAWQVVYVRLRFLVVLAVAFLVVGQWHVLRNYWDRLTRSTGGMEGSQAVSLDTEYFCPMCPGVLSDWPSKCPVCNMALVRRKKGEAVPLPDGVVARMQLSPYRVQLAGIQTAVLEYRPLVREVVTAGLVEAGTDPARVAARAEVSDRELPLLADGQAAEVTSEAFAGRVPFRGRVRFGSAGIAPGTRPLRILIEIDNPRQELRPGLFVTARVQVPAGQLPWLGEALTQEWQNRTAVDLAARALVTPVGTGAGGGIGPLLWSAVVQAQRQRGMVLAVPETAVVDTGSRRVVYVESMPGTFDGVEVALGPRCGDYYPVLRGLEAGQRVATVGAFLVDAETRLNPSIAAGYFGAGRGSGGEVAAPATAEPAAEAKALLGLAPADRELAARQKVCPVTGAKLGSMGTPARVVVEGKTVFLCCDGCEDELRRNAGKYLPKLQTK
jgi:hypothetical protein